MNSFLHLRESKPLFELSNNKFSLSKKKKSFGLMFLQLSLLKSAAPIDPVSDSIERLHFEKKLAENMSDDPVTPERMQE